MKKKMDKVQLIGEQENTALKANNFRMGNIALPHYMKDTIDGTNTMAEQLMTRGGFPQQNRMIRDKRHALDKAMLYSYQAALIKKYIPEKDREKLMESEKQALKVPVRGLINSNKLKQDYDDKVLSTGYENNFHPGDIFEWCNTKSFWLIYLQDLTELAYFRGDIRRCNYQIAWEEDDGIYSTYVAVRGPVETKVEYIQKHTTSVDFPNWSLNILMPKNEHTLEYFRRYSKFYLKGAEGPDARTCWRVEAVNTISMIGVIEVNAVEYYSNTFEDDIENGLVGTLITEPVDPNPPKQINEITIVGDTFIRPTKEYTYTIDKHAKGEWFIKDQKLNHAVILKQYRDPDTEDICVVIKWNVTYSGQFDLCFGEYKKTIVVESLF